MTPDSDISKLKIRGKNINETQPKKKKSPNSTNFKPKVIRCIEKNTQEPKAILLVTFLEMVSLRDLWKVVKVTSNDQEEKKIHGYSSRGGFVDHALSPKISGT